MMAVDDLKPDPRTERVDGISLKAHWPRLAIPCYKPTSRSFSPKTEKTTQSLQAEHGLSEGEATSRHSLCNMVPGPTPTPGDPMMRLTF